MKVNININKLVYLALALLICLLPLNLAKAREVIKEDTKVERVSIIVDGGVEVFDKILEVDKTAEKDRVFTIIEAFSCKVKKESLKDLKEKGITYHIEEKVEPVTSDIPTNLENLPYTILGQEDDKTSLADKDIEKYDGRGKVVAVLDSGVDVNHKDLKKAPLTPKLTKEVVEGKKSQSGLKGKFYSEKIPYAYNYADKNDDIIDRDTKKIDYGHGMHVIGIIAANSPDGKGMTGVSKNAQVISMKVFSNDPQDQGKSTEGAIIEALEDSVSLGADVVNMSLTIPCGIADLQNPLQRAVNAVIEKGIVVVTAAGNDAYTTFPNAMIDDSGTVGSPAVVENSIAVASYENEMMNMSAFNHKGKKIPYSEIHKDITKIKDLKLYDGGDGKKEELPQNDGIVLIHRSGLKFTDMVKDAYEKGAKAVILYNKEKDTEYISNVGQIKEDIPVIFISYEDGIYLKENLNEIPDFTLDSAIVANNVKGMSSFSSNGPTSDLSIKPEITAIGGKVLSLSNGDDYKLMSGTSMAAPYVAGVVMNYMNYLDENKTVYTPSSIKNALMNSSTVQKDDKGLAYPVGKQGAGLVSLKALLNQDISVEYETKAKIELREIGEAKDFNLLVKNRDGKKKKIKISFSDVLTHDKATTNSKGLNKGSISTPSKEVDLNGEDVTLPISLKVAGDGGYVFGYIFIESENCKLTIPYLAYKGDFKSLPIFDKNKGEAGSIFNEQGLFTKKRIDNYRYGLIELGKNMNFDTFGINPTDDKANNNAVAKISLLRNVKDFSIYVKNDRDEIISYIEHQASQKKSNMYENRRFLSDEFWAWNGVSYDKTIGKKLPVDEGIYKYVIEAYPAIDGAEKQSLVFPIKVDKTPPSVSSDTIIAKSNFIELQIKAKDEGKVTTGIDKFLFVIDGKSYKEEGKTLFELKEENGVYKKLIKLDENLPDNFVIQVGVTDYAGNMGQGIYKILKNNKEMTFETRDNKDKFGLNEEIQLKFSYKGAVSYKIYREDKKEALVETKENQATIKIDRLGDINLIAEAYDTKGARIALKTKLININKTDTHSDIEITPKGEFVGKTYKTKIQILNKFGEKKNITYITSVYDENMKLLNTASTTVSLGAYEKAAIKNEVMIEEKGKIIKNFVWDDLGQLNTINEEKVEEVK